MKPRKLCNCFTEINPDIEKWVDWTGKDEFAAVYTIQLGELVESGVFDWKRPMLDWSAAAYDTEQYERVCSYFIERYYFREISIEPFAEWANYLNRKLVFELMPKYRILYAEAAREWTIKSGGKEYGNTTRTEAETIEQAATETQENGATSNVSETQTQTGTQDNYYKSRSIDSEYPETILSGNSDYISNGNDTEDERVIEDSKNTTSESESESTENRNKNNNASSEREKNFTETYERNKDVSTVDYVTSAREYADFFGQLDKRLVDELESLFICMYTTNVNATW